LIAGYPLSIALKPILSLIVEAVDAELLWAMAIT
jgi:hypothetical protein